MADGKRTETKKPEELLTEAMTRFGCRKIDLARGTGLSRQTVYELLDGRVRITPLIAARFGKLFGTGPAVWINVQAVADIERAAEIDVSAIDTLARPAAPASGSRGEARKPAAPALGG